jgi:hypothetical protein
MASCHFHLSLYSLLRSLFLSLSLSQGNRQVYFLSTMQLKLLKVRAILVDVIYYYKL